MLEILDHRSIGELIPLAEIDPANDLFYRGNIKFAPDFDEWGAHHIAAFQTPDLKPFAVVHYDQDPKTKAHLFVTGEVPAEPASLLAAIASALHLPPEAFHWRDNRGK